MPTSAASFWKYFRETEEALRASSVTQALISDFEQHLHAVVETDWEIGPGENQATRLSLSPSPDDAAAVAAVKDLLDVAPHIAGWEFSLYKPPRKWDLRFSVTADGDEHRIDGSKWQVVLYAFEDGSFDFVFRPDRSSDRLETSVLEHAAAVIVDGELGEQFRLEQVGEISVVKEWSEDEEPSAQRLKPGLLVKLVESARNESS